MCVCRSCADDVGQCTPSAECAPEWGDEGAAVVAIYAVDVRMGALGLCTGEGVRARFDCAWAIAACMSICKLLGRPAALHG